MDYMAELASHPDVLEALQIQGNRELFAAIRAAAAESRPEPPPLTDVWWTRSLVDDEDSEESAAVAADELRRNYAFLRDEHPNVWMAELIHLWYRYPFVASAVWRNLRYCNRFRHELAADVLARVTAPWWLPTGAGRKELEPLVPQTFVAEYRARPRDAVAGFADALATELTLIDQIRAITRTSPLPPRFLVDLLSAAQVPVIAHARRTQELLAAPADVRQLANATQVSVPFSLVLDAELRQIHRTRQAIRRSGDNGDAATPAAPVQAAPTRRAIDANLLGLAFSGGGIRSATFNLGVLQSLAQIGLLKHCDYLSTVSGGGYIGSWLAAWTHRESLNHSPGHRVEAIIEIQRRLSPPRNPNPISERVRPIRFLREYSNYLTPRTGFFSADTWTMVGIYVRNALLNQVIIVALFASLLLLPRDAFMLLNVIDRPGLTIPAVMAVLWLFGAAALVANLRRLDPRGSESTRQASRPTSPAAAILPWYAQPAMIQRMVIVPWLIACALAAHRYGEWATQIGATGLVGANVIRVCGMSALILAATVGAVLTLGGANRCWTQEPSGKIARVEALWSIALATLAVGALTFGLTWLLLKALLEVESYGWEYAAIEWNATAIGTAGLLAILSLAIVVQLGMLGERFPDEHREWWSRLRTFLHIYAVGWLAWWGVALYVPWIADAFARNNFGWKSGVTALGTWIATTVFGVKKAQTAEGELKKQRETTERGWMTSTTVLRYATLVAPYVFMIGLIMALALAIDGLYWQFDESLRVDVTYWNHVMWSATPWVVAWTVVCFLVGVLFSLRVDINEFSMHHFYKNRLVRCYLGASRGADRMADWFTGFDPADDLRLAVFDHESVSSRKYRYQYPGPYPILNCALNLVAGEDLAWQERKAESFVFTPKYCGYDLDRAVLSPSTPATDSKTRNEAYVPTQSFYHAGEGPLLGMATAISGAAANPNMGRATSPASAFLMTVFNARLGWWLGNPRRPDGCPKPGPPLGLTYTALELIGGTDDKREFVNVSDGGHFDNLGVYELIRRGCRYIIASDAGQDARLLCEDLGDLIRRCRTDFGVEIDINVDMIRRNESSSPSQSHCVVGKIRYLNIPKRDDRGNLMNDDGGPLREGDRPAHEQGYLVYIKPSITGDEPHDVLEYYRRVPEFPHQTTADQWFGESQFESYRRLGMHIAERAFTRYQHDDTRPVASMDELFGRLFNYWYPPVLGVGSSGGDNGLEYATEYSRIMELIRETDALKPLDPTVFEHLPKPNGNNTAARNEFYVCNALIQLTENVYLALDLEHQWEHPHVQGWMDVFKRWARQPAFRRTWRVSEETFAERFRNFYNDRLRGRALGLRPGFISSWRGRVTAADPGANSIDMFAAALAAGATVLAIDVRKLASGELVVCHEQDLDGKPVATLSAADLAAHHPAIPLLDECLRRFRGQVQLALHLEVTGIAKDALDALMSGGWSFRDFVLMSSDLNVLQAARDAHTEARIGLSVEQPGYRQAFNDFLTSGVDFLAPRDGGYLTAAELDRAAKARVLLVPLGVNDSERLRLLLSHDAVAGVITEEVALARQVKRRL